MKYSILTASALTCLASASTIGGQEIHALESWKRGSPQAPNGYAPAEVDCPSTRPSIRVASDLSDQEKSWLEKRRPNTVQPMREMLTRMNITGFDVGAYINKHQNNATALPNIGLAFSGGGYRAMLNGAGALAAFDNRTPGSTGAGQIGGLLQSATYIAGLSGGSWLVGSIYNNNFTTVTNTISQNDDGDVWQLDRNILQGPKQGGIQILNTADYYKNLLDSVQSKEDAPGKFNISLTDYWGRALSFQLVNATDGGPAYTWSSIQDDEDFRNANAPFPIIVALERAPNEILLSLNATDIEFNPFEMGSFDPTLYGFAPLRYLGSNFSNGELPDNQGCIAGFDNAGFIMGTSSSLFNQALLNLDSYVDLPDFLTNAIEGLLTVIGDDSNDIADYTPNPFKGFNNNSNPSASEDRLTLVDGGEDLQNIPFNPLIQPVRAVDVIFAVDSSADFFAPTDSAENWPNGTSLVATYERTYNETMQNGTAFPYIPDTNTIINLGLNNRPAFFGCNSSNLTADGTAPLIVYIPNSPYMFASNVSTFTMSYSDSDRNNIILNGYNVATQANGTRENASTWPTCVGCAVLQRSMERNGEEIPQVCQQCFTQYCWNGTLQPEKPAPYFPQFILTEVKSKSGAGALVSKPFHFALAVAVSAMLLL